MAKNLCTVCLTEGKEAPVVGGGLCRKHYNRMYRKGSTDDTRKNVRQICSVDGCSKPHKAQGWCDTHYRRFKAYGDVNVILERPTVCAVDGCENSVSSHALCDLHYRRKRKHGDPLVPRICASCGQEYSESSRSKYCSAECLEVESGRRRREEGRKIQLKQYGLSVEEYDRMLKSQGFSCKICRTSEPGGHGKHFHVDHDHETGEVRGLLCEPCNTGLGKFKDDPKLLRSAADYLERSTG